MYSWFYSIFLSLSDRTFSIRVKRISSPYRYWFLCSILGGSSFLISLWTLDLLTPMILWMEYVS